MSLWDSLEGVQQDVRQAKEDVKSQTRSMTGTFEASGQQLTAKCSRLSRQIKGRVGPLTGQLDSFASEVAASVPGSGPPPWHSNSCDALFLVRPMAGRSELSQVRIGS